MSLEIDAYTAHMQQRYDKYFKGKLVSIYVDAVQIPLSGEGFAETFVGYVHEIDVFDIVIRNISEDPDEPDRFTMIPISAIKTISEIGSIKKARENHLAEEAKREALKTRQNDQKA